MFKLIFYELKYLVWTLYYIRCWVLPIILWMFLHFVAKFQHTAQTQSNLVYNEKHKLNLHVLFIITDKIHLSSFDPLRFSARQETGPPRPSELPARWWRHSAARWGRQAPPHQNWGTCWRRSQRAGRRAGSAPGLWWKSGTPHCSRTSQKPPRWIPRPTAQSPGGFHTCSRPHQTRRRRIWTECCRKEEEIV